MSLLVSDLLQLPVARQFHLVAGENGLTRRVKHVNLLDYEYDGLTPDGISGDGLFDRDAVIVTSFLFLKDNPEKILPVVKQLKADQVSALAVKKVYFRELPREVLDYADDEALPIFMSDLENSYSENVVVGLTEAIEDFDNSDMLESSVKKLLKETEASERFVLAREIFKGLEGTYRMVCLKPKKKLYSVEFQHTIQRLRTIANVTVLPYEGRILLAVEGNDEDFQYELLMSRLNLSTNAYYSGISISDSGVDNISEHIKESIYACDLAEKRSQDLINFKDMGVWQMLEPNKDDIWIKNYCRRAIRTLGGRNSAHSPMLDTIREYVRQDLSINAAADAMHVHKNTIRYRISKAKEMLGIENDLEFHFVIYLITRIYGL